MKKNTSILLLLITIAIFVTSCGKDKNKTKIEMPMQTTIKEQMVVDSVISASFGSWEFGQKLFFSKNGKITKLGCKMANTGNFRVSLWAFATKDLIAATTVTITDSTKFVYNTVSPISVTANTRYVVSVNNTYNGVGWTYYLYIKKSNTTGASIYPFTTGSVTYEALQEQLSATSSFPIGVVGLDQQFLPSVDLQFEYEE